jgi:hypothetical protein
MNTKIYYPLFLSIAIICLGYPSAARADSGHSKLQYLFPAFETGKIFMKSGGFYEVPLNYNTLTEEMVFDKNGTKMLLSSPDLVDSIYLQGKVFIYTGTAFYEVLLNAPVSAFIQHRSIIINEGTPIGYGATSYSSQPVPVSTYRSLFGANYSLELTQKEYYVEPDSQNWIRKNNTYYIANNTKEIQKIFPEHAEEIKKLIKDNKIKLSDSENFIRLVRYLNELVK